MGPNEFRTLEEKFGLPPGTLAAVMQAESSGDPMARSRKGARGPFQLMPVNSAGIDPHRMDQASQRAAEILGGHLKRFGDFPAALAAYNAGPRAVANAGGVPNYPETKSYIDKVQARIPTPTPPMLPMTDYSTDLPPETVNQSLMRQFEQIRQARQP